MKNIEDKKVLEFINKNYEVSHGKFIKNQKKKKRKETISNIIWFIACIIALIILTSVIVQDTRKAVKNCVKLGHSYNYCLKESQ